MAEAWVIIHGDRDRATSYWTGYRRKEHHFSHDVQQAIRFCRESDARRAGVNLTLGSGVRKIAVDEDGKAR